MERWRYRCYQFGGGCGAPPQFTRSRHHVPARTGGCGDHLGRVRRSRHRGERRGRCRCRARGHRRGPRAARAREAGDRRGIDRHVRWDHLDAEQPVDAGRRRRRLTRGRARVPRGRRRRRGAGVVAGATRDVPHRGLQDAHLPAAEGRAAGPVRGLQRLLPERQGRQRARALGRGRAVRRPAARRVARQAPAEPRQGLRARGEDERAALGAVLQPVAASVHHRRARVPPHARPARCVVRSCSPTARR